MGLVEFHQGSPDANAEFVCQMEDVLNVSQRPYAPQRPMACFDDAREACLLAEPLAGRRQKLVTARRTAKVDAEAIRYLVDEMHPDAESIVLVRDKLNTYKPVSLYHAFSPEEARRRIDRLAIHDTPKHGSWLTAVE